MTVVLHTLDQAANRTQVVVAEGDALEVHLAENPTTGYRWRMDGPGDDVITFDASEFRQSGPAIGAGGLRVLRFVARRAGTAAIALTRSRLAGDAAPDAADRFIVTVVVGS